MKSDDLVPGLVAIVILYISLVMATLPETHLELPHDALIRGMRRIALADDLVSIGMSGDHQGDIAAHRLERAPALESAQAESRSNISGGGSPLIEREAFEKLRQPLRARVVLWW